MRPVLRGYQAFHTQKKSALLTEPAHLLLVAVADVACPQNLLGTGLPAEGTAEAPRGRGLLHVLGQTHSAEEVSTVSAHGLLQVLLADGADALFPAILPQRDHGLHPPLPASCLQGLLPHWGFGRPPMYTVQRRWPSWTKAVLEQPGGHDSCLQLRATADCPSVKPQFLLLQLQVIFSGFRSGEMASR